MNHERIANRNTINYSTALSEDSNLFRGTLIPM